MASNVDSEVRRLVDSFAAELTDLIQQAVEDAVRGALRSSPASSGGRGKKKAAKKGGARRGRPPGKAGKARKTSKKKGAASATATTGGVKRGKRTKAGWVRRSPEYLDDLERRLYGEIKKKGDRRIEEIAKSMGEPTRNLALPAKKLIAAKKVKTKGQKRATRYSAT